MLLLTPWRDGGPGTRMEWMMPALAAAAAVLAWIVASFVGTPIRRFWDIRGNVSRALVAHAQFIPGPSTIDELLSAAQLRGVPLRNAAAEELRTLGLDLIAFWSNETLARSVLKLGGIDAGRAGRELVDVALAIDTRVSARPDAFGQIASALRLRL